MGDLRTSEQYVGVSGVTGSFISNQVGATQAVEVSGESKNVVGPIILNAVIPSIISGGAITTFSGQQLVVNDAISGMYALGSGLNHYFYDAGTHSGTIADAEYIPGDLRGGPPTTIYPNILCRSGLACSASGTHFKLNVYYTPVEVA